MLCLQIRQNNFIFGLRITVLIAAKLNTFKNFPKADNFLLCKTDITDIQTV